MSALPRVEAGAGGRPIDTRVLVVAVAAECAEHTLAAGSEYYPVLLTCNNLREAWRRSPGLPADAQGRRPCPLLRLHTGKPVSGGSAGPAIQVLPFGRSIASLLGDAALLGIAEGAVITFDADVDREAVASTLAEHRFSTALLEPDEVLKHFT